MARKFDYSNLSAEDVEQIVSDRCDSIRNSSRWGSPHESLLAEDDFEDLVRTSVQARVAKGRSLYEQGIYEDIRRVSFQRDFDATREAAHLDAKRRNAAGLLPLHYTEYDTPPACDILYRPDRDPKSGIRHWRLREEYYDLVHNDLTEAPVDIRVRHVNEEVDKLLKKYNLDVSQLVRFI